MEPMNLFRARDLGELLQDTLRFVVQESRSFWVGLMLYVGPFYLIIGILSGLVLVDTIHVFALLDLDITDVTAISKLSLPDLFPLTAVLSWKIPALLILSVLGISAFYSYVYSYMQVYSEAELEEVSLSTVRTETFAKLPRMVGTHLLKNLYLLLLQISLFWGTILLISLVNMLFADMPGVAAVLTGLLALTAVGTGIYLYVPLALIYPIQVNEESGGIGGIRRVYDLIRGHWWQTLGLVMVLSLLLSFVEGMIVGGSMSAAYTPQIIGTLALGSGLLISGVRLITRSVLAVGVGLQYYNLQEDQENEETDSHIDDIGEDV